MAEPDNLVLVLLRDFRKELDRQDEERRRLERRFDAVRQAVHGESVLGRYAVAEVEDELTAIRARLDALEAKA